MKKVLLLVFTLALFSSACDKEDEKQERIDRKKILEYIAKNELVMEEAPSGLFYVIEEPGTGDHPSLSSIIKLHYKGYLLNGYMFESSDETGDPVTFQLRYLIKGLKEGVPLFKKEGKGKLIIPSSLGYGSASYPDIPANSVLIFEIHLVDFD